MEPNYASGLPDVMHHHAGGTNRPGAHSSRGRAGLQGVPARRGCFVLCSLSNFALWILFLMKNFHAE